MYWEIVRLYSVNMTEKTEWDGQASESESSKRSSRCSLRLLEPPQMRRLIYWHVHLQLLDTETALE